MAVAVAMTGLSHSYGAVVVTVPPSPIPTVAAFPAVFYDLDGNGTDDMSLQNDGLSVWGRSGGPSRLLGDPLFLGFRAVAVPEGAFIGIDTTPGTEWTTDRVSLNACSNGSCSGDYDGGIDYLGVEFEISGATHYGWLEIESAETFTFALVHRWAYETEPGVGIVAGIPEPGTGALVLVGATLGLAARRRR
jgi:hypothetical protein